MENIAAAVYCNLTVTNVQTTTSDPGLLLQIITYFVYWSFTIYYFEINSYSVIDYIIIMI